jgi:tRNA A-37 threonylcarbamoyl transferase component Bud32
MQQFTIDSYHLGSSNAVSERQAREIVRLLHEAAPDAGPGLEGRIGVIRGAIEGIGAVAVKSYRRGGAIRHILRKRYLRFGKTRAQREYEMLCHVRRLGVSAPEPVAFAWRGGLFYTAWLVLREIRGAVSLAEMSRTGSDRLAQVFPEAAEEIRRLIRLKLFHADLHPGNLLVDGSGRVFLVDFDKSRTFSGDPQSLKAGYLSRWERAVRKHRLPQAVSRMLRSELERDHAAS